MTTLRLRKHEPGKVEKIELTLSMLEESQKFDADDLVYGDYVKAVYRDGNRFIKINRKRR